MHYFNDFEGWKVHHDELLREAEGRRLARQLSAARSAKTAPESRHSLLGLFAWLLPQGGRMADC